MFSRSQATSFASQAPHSPRQSVPLSIKKLARAAISVNFFYAVCYLQVESGLYVAIVAEGG